jgi:hypothetical protein
MPPSGSASRTARKWQSGCSTIILLHTAATTSPLKFYVSITILSMCFVSVRTFFVDFVIFPIAASRGSRETVAPRGSHRWLGLPYRYVPVSFVSPRVLKYSIPIQGRSSISRSSPHDVESSDAGHSSSPLRHSTSSEESPVLRTSKPFYKLYISLSWQDSLVLI